MSQVHPRRIRCPLCEEAFDGWLVLAGPDRGPLSSELRRYTESEDPIPKQVNGCPGCGYTGTVSSFEEMAPKPDQLVASMAIGAFFSQAEWEDAHDPMLADRPVSEASTLREQLDEHLSTAAGEAHTDPALRYEHHAQVERWLGSGPLREGDSWLRAAWLHDDGDRPREGRRCRERALHCYRRGVEERKWFARREDLVVIAYLVGELHRRLDNAEEAARWFEQAIAWSSGLQKLQDLVQLAERQAQDPRDLV